MNKHAKQIDILFSTLSTRHFDFYSEVAEFFLRSQLYDKAYRIYRFLDDSGYDASDGRIYLRMTETIAASRPSKEEVSKYLEKLKKLVEKRQESLYKFTQDEITSYYHALRYAWRFGNRKLAASP